MAPYCLCKKRGEGQMVGCDKCLNWFHLQCVGLTEKQVSLFPDKWYCHNCQELLRKEDIKEILFSEEAKQFIKTLISVELKSTEALNIKNIEPSSEQVLEKDKNVHEQCELKMKTLKEEYEGKVKKMIEDYNSEQKTKEEIREEYENKLLILKENYESTIKIQKEEEIQNEELRKMYEQRVEKIKEDHEKEKQGMREEYKSKIQSLESLCVKMEEEITQLKKRIINKRKLSLSQQERH